MKKAATDIHVQVVVGTGLILNVNLHDGVLMFPLAFSVTCGYGTKAQKWIQKCTQLRIPVYAITVPLIM